MAVTYHWIAVAICTKITIKDFFIVLMSLVDTNCKFLCIDVSSDGTINAANIYNRSELKECLESPNNIFNLPKEKSLPGDNSYIQSHNI